MIAPLVLAIMAYAVIIVVAAIVNAVRRSGRPRWLGAGGWTLQALLVVQAVIAVAMVLRGQGPARPTLFVAYLVVAVALLPLCGAFATGVTTSSARGSVRADAALAVAAGVALIVQWRLVVTWRAGNA